MTQRNCIHAYPGRSQRLRCYEVLGQALSEGSRVNCQWHEKPLAVPAQGELNCQLTPAACRIVNAVIKRYGGTIDVYVCGSEIYLVRDEKAPWDDIDTQMLSLIKAEVWPNQAVEMWTQKERRPV